MYLKRTVCYVRADASRMRDGFILFIDSNETFRQTSEVKRIYSSPIVPCSSFASLYSPSTSLSSLCYHPRQIIQSDKVESPGLVFNYEYFTSYYLQSGDDDA